MNPYDWQRHVPEVEVQRTEVALALEPLRRGGSAVMLGGRGMGKSVFLRQLRAAVEGSPDVRAVLLPAPPPELSVSACFEALARRLGMEADGVPDARELLEAYLEREDTPNHLVLLYDEFDRYAQHGTGASDPPGRRFFNDLEAARRALPGVGILAAGSIGVFVFRDVLGSSFLSRAEQYRLSPFERSEIRTLARPFWEHRDTPFEEEVLEALHLASGGNPALVTYGLQELWERTSPTARDVAEIYAAFQQRHREFLRDVQLSFSDPGLSEAPWRVWDLVRRSSGPLSRDALKEACATADSPLQLDFADVLHLLQAAGLVRVVGSLIADDPVDVRPIASILALPHTSAAVADLRQRMLGDLRTLLGSLHTFSADFFRQATKDDSEKASGKQIAPEAVFAGVLALGFMMLGWQVEREAQSAAGRTDLKLRREGSAGIAILETKIWGRHDYKKAHRQVESYWSAQVVAGAVVMFTDIERPHWPRTYRETCLDPLGLLPVEQRDPSSPIQAHFKCASTTADGMEAEIDHFLLRLPHRD